MLSRQYGEFTDFAARTAMASSFPPIPHRLVACRLLLLALCAAALTAQAQPAAPTARPDPLDPRARVPALVYETSLSPPPRAGNDKPIAWRDANDAVARIGGWRTYLRETQQPDPAAAEKPVAPAQAPASAPAAAAKLAPAGHSGHKH